MKVQITADDLLRGLLAALTINSKGPASLEGSRPRIHRAFRRVLEQVEQPPFSAQVQVDLFDVDFDPLYGQSRWLDRALTRAQRGRVISFPNPRYQRIDVQLGAKEASDVLDEIGAREPFLELARLFRNELPSVQPEAAAP